MADLLVCGDAVLTSAQAPPLLHGAVLIRDGAVAAVGERAALCNEYPRAS
jgi:predicted amidohydrolase YtcJ